MILITCFGLAWYGLPFELAEATAAIESRLAYMLHVGMTMLHNGRKGVVLVSTWLAWNPAVRLLCGVLLETDEKARHESRQRCWRKEI